MRFSTHLELVVQHGQWGSLINDESGTLNAPQLQFHSGPSLRRISCCDALAPLPWRFEPIPGGYRVIDANGLALAHVYGQPPDAIPFSFST